VWYCSNVSEPVKPRRRYRSQLRRQQAAATRTAILDAARQLMAEVGFTGATIRSIAERAGVSRETVYATFGSKWGIVTALGGLNIERAAMALLPEGGLGALEAVADLDRQLELFGELGARIMAGNWAIVEAMRVGGATDPELAALYRRASDGRRAWMQRLVTTWEHAGRLRAGVDSGQAIDALWAMTGPELYRLLVVERGWTDALYATWLQDAARRLVLR
jgi:AcrR family transcriptional regulator